MKLKQSHFSGNELPNEYFFPFCHCRSRYRNLWNFLKFHFLKKLIFIFCDTFETPLIINKFAFLIGLQRIYWYLLLNTILDIFLYIVGYFNNKLSIIHSITTSSFQDTEPNSICFCVSFRYFIFQLPSV